jgi:carboxybiotin decarboxylase
LVGNIAFVPGYKIGVYEAGSVLNYLFWGFFRGFILRLFSLGIGAMTDFSAFISNPKLILIGAAAQLGIFGAYAIAFSLGFSPAEAGAIAIIGGADGPTAIFLSSKLAPDLWGLLQFRHIHTWHLVPVIQPPL